MSSSARVPDLEKIRKVIRTCPLIDNHAHNLLLHDRPEQASFLSITSEARGEALNDAVNSLAHIRAASQLQELYSAESQDWDSILSARKECMDKRHHELMTNCFKDCHTILMDDGLDQDTVHPYEWHDQFTTGRTHRIMRIEALAEDILRSEIASFDELSNFDAIFKARIKKALNSTHVAGFKSVICYRTGLAIDEETEYPESSLRKCLAEAKKDRHGFRIFDKSLNDWIVLTTLDYIATHEHPKPIQFHTGLGDNDLSLSLADPSHLQSVIHHFPQVPFVLLHSSYPFTRSAGYLAALYKNAFLDIGLVFPMLSREGQEAVLRQALELVPSNKILWSTDGHWFAETYYLANRQFKEALETVSPHSRCLLILTAL